MKRMLSRLLMHLLWWLPLAASANILRHEQISTWMRTGQYDIMDDALMKLQREFERDRVQDESLSRSFMYFSRLADPSEATERAFNEWITLRPTSYAAHLARGIFYVSVGKASAASTHACRNPETAGKVDNVWFNLAERDLLATLPMSPAPLLSHTWLMSLAVEEKEAEAIERYFTAAAAYAPRSNDLHRTYMHTLRPRQGGSVAAMERFATEREPILGPGLATDTLWGMIWDERTRPLFQEGEYQKIEDMLTPVLTKYGSRRLYCQRAQARVALDKWSDAMQDMQTAVKGMSLHDYCSSVAVYMAHYQPERPGMLELLDGFVEANPENLELRRYRGWVHLMRDNPQGAYPDLLYAAEQGNAWAQGHIARFQLKGMGHIAPDPARALPLLQAAALNGDAPSQAPLVQALRALGRSTEAEFEERRYRVSEAARPPVNAVTRQDLPLQGRLRHLQDSRVQAVSLALLIMLLLLYRGRSQKSS